MWFSNVKDLRTNRRTSDAGRGTTVRIILARPRGFCAGVNMAVETLDRYGATFEERPVREETMQFQLPPELRALAGRGRD